MGMEYEDKADNDKTYLTIRPTDNRAGIMSIKGHALTFDDGDPTSVATALASTMCDPTGLVRMGFARLSTSPVEARYRYELTNGVISALSRSAGTYREFHKGRVSAFVDEYMKRTANIPEDSA